jgi:hypothetical protein
MRGVLVGAFTLIVLQVLVANPRATNAVGGVAGGASKVVAWFLDPNTPAIPDRSSNSVSTAAEQSPVTAAPAMSPNSAGVPVGSPPGNTGLVPGVPVV